MFFIEHQLPQSTQMYKMYLYTHAQSKEHEDMIYEGWSKTPQRHTPKSGRK